jgi:hypothetical protein
MNIEFNFWLIVGHTLLLETKGAEPLGEVWAVNGADGYAPTTQESMDQILRAYSSNLPEMVRAQVAGAQQYEPAMLALRQQVSPGQNQLDLDLLNQFGQQFADTNQRIAGNTALNRAGDDLRLINGPGRDLARSALAMQREADPEAYRARGIAVDQLDRLNKSLVDPDADMSGSERAEIDRSLARDNFSKGLGAVPTATSTVSNALKFGQAGENRRTARQSAIADAAKISSGAVQPLSSGIDTFQLTTGRSSALGPAGSGSREVGADTNAMGSGLLNNATNIRQQENQINSQRRDALDRVSQVMSSLPSISCCWIFAEAYYGWNNIPDEVRVSRDMHYTLQRREGYRLMSKWLVPMMQTNPFVRFLVMWLLINPMTSHAKWYVNRKGIGWIFSPLQQFYLAIWEFYGQRAGVPAEVYNLRLADGPWNVGIYPR